MSISINQVIVVGRLGRDPETRYAAQGGTAICDMAVATSRRYKDRDGNRQEETEWHKVVLFGRLAEIAQQYLQKGSEVYIEGRLRTRSYEKDGIKRWKTEVVGEELQLGSRANPAPAQAGASGFEFQAPRPQAQAQAPAGGLGDISEDYPF